MVQRRYRDFDRLAAALARHAGLNSLERMTSAGKKALPPLPRPTAQQTLSKDKTPEFAAARQEALQQWLDMITQRPQLWCGELQAFLGLVPANGGEAESAEVEGAGAGVSAVVPPPTAEIAELEWVASRMGSTQGGVQRQSGGVVRGDTIVRWLLAQALAGSREQAITLAEAMRRQGLLKSTGKKADAKFERDFFRLDSQEIGRHTAPP